MEQTSSGLSAISPKRGERPGRNLPFQKSKSERRVKPSPLWEGVGRGLFTLR